MSEGKCFILGLVFISLLVSLPVYASGVTDEIIEGVTVDVESDVVVGDGGVDSDVDVISDGDIFPSVSYNVYGSDGALLYTVVPDVVDGDSLSGSDGGVSVFAAPPPSSTLQTVSANDLQIFLGSGAHDFLAYRVNNNTTVCLYPVTISSSGFVAGDDVTEITIYSNGTSRSISYGQDDISLQLDSYGYYYSDIKAPYVMQYPAESYRSTFDTIVGYVLIAFLVLSLAGSLFRRGNS